MCNTVQRAEPNPFIQQVHAGYILLGPVLGTTCEGQKGREPERADRNSLPSGHQTVCAHIYLLPWQSSF